MQKENASYMLMTQLKVEKLQFGQIKDYALSTGSEPGHTLLNTCNLLHFLSVTDTAEQHDLR